MNYKNKRQFNKKKLLSQILDTHFEIKMFKAFPLDNKQKETKRKYK